MIEKSINTYAAAFAARVKGAVETYRDLYIVSYDYGLSPSVAYWQGEQSTPTNSIHFLHPDIRDDRIRQIKEQKDQELSYNQWSVSVSY